MTAREEQAKALGRWLASQGPHPHGQSGLRFLVPNFETKNCWDVCPRAYGFSEWGNDAGIT